LLAKRKKASSRVRAEKSKHQRPQVEEKPSWPAHLAKKKNLCQRSKGERRKLPGKEDVPINTGRIYGKETVSERTIYSGETAGQKKKGSDMSRPTVLRRQSRQGDPKEEKRELQPVVAQVFRKIKDRHTRERMTLELTKKENRPSYKQRFE